MMKRFLILLLVVLLCTDCGSPSQQTSEQKYQASFLTLFDTVTYITGFSNSEECFSAIAQDIHDQLLEYHQLFDIYENYDGIANLKTVNDLAGIQEVPVDQRIIDLLLDCKSYYELTDGMVNAAMGSVLSLWHEARTAGIQDPDHARLPDSAALEEAAKHMDFDCVIIDEAASTVYITDPQVQLDVGAIAKGWALQKVAANAPKGLLISLGGNVCATGPKDAAGTPWIVGIQNPDGGEDYLHTLYVTGGSVVTSGDYQRYYTVDGVVYHHIIDPRTRYPSNLWRSVTVVCDDSGLGDALSTALFLLSQEAGEALLEHCGAVAMWVDPEGAIFYSPGFQDLIRT